MASRAMVQAARELRQRQTPAESRLWACLRNRRLAGLKFRRQHPVANTNYVVDFFCYDQLLIIELDGEIHNYQGAADRERQGILEAEGYRVLHFTNEAVWLNLGDVLKQIVQFVAEESSK